jgi:glycosyltransferase involved in cell wall biosynthesis
MHEMKMTTTKPEIMSDAEARAGNPSTPAPAVSVIIPAFNVAAFIGETLDSVFNQTFDDYEVIVVNDGSPDTVELTAALAPFASRIIYIEQENAGPSGARNAGIRSARGRFVALLDGDDVWLPSFLEEQIECLNAGSPVDFVYADAVNFGDHPQSGLTSIESYPSTAEVTFESLLRLECIVQTSGVVARRATLIAAGLFDPRFCFAEDFDLWLRVAHLNPGCMFHNRRVLVRHRLHRASLSADPTRMYAGRTEVYRKACETFALTAEHQEIIETEIRNCTAHIHLEAGKRRLLAGDYDDAEVELRRAADLSPTRKLRALLLCLRAAPSLVGKLYRLREQPHA